MNQFGLVSWCLPGDLFNAIELCRENSTQSLQIDFGGNGRGALLASYDLQKLRNSAIDNNVNITAIALNLYNDIGITPSSIECKSIFFEATRLANELKISTLFIPSFRKSLIEKDIDIINTAFFLQWCCDAAGSDFTVASENILTPEKSKILYRIVNRSNFKIIFDPANLYIAKVSPCNYLSELFNHLHTDVHIKSTTKGTFYNLNIDFKKVIKSIINSPNLLLHNFIFFIENDYRERDYLSIKEDISWLKNNFKKLDQHD
ncbi:hypothetical protein KKJ25_09560 [Xenorhabdus bovienii]|uniref:hypothetical protein n=1 Tax=Xenorhabdus bovienii TaxID=40576 RepID=UPI00237C6734|nr:hypothetical protein [Xenorhabdus bovienii]MDE1490303.1 hypothetical protein [Xenorhabdus bovienii]MDE1495186.1 hypothetical protein [Xenorhabdus bovienii]MDE9473270.1 hypothetical protein [Xenorhabdus bovienii]